MLSSPPVLDVIESLLDKSLLQQVDHGGEEPRVLMLETIREYGLECLAAAGEMKQSQRAHTTYYIALAERAESELFHHQQELWMGRLERDYENIRASLNWLQEQHAQEQLMNLAGSLGWFWYMRGSLKEGQYWLELALQSSPPNAFGPVRCRVLALAALLTALLLGQRGLSIDPAESAWR